MLSIFAKHKVKRKKILDSLQTLNNNNNENLKKKESLYHFVNFISFYFLFFFIFRKRPLNMQREEMKKGSTDIRSAKANMKQGRSAKGERE